MELGGGGGGGGESQEQEKYIYSVWAIPPEDVTAKLKKVMEGLRSEFGGPEFQPHITLVGAISLTESDALHKFNSASQSLKPYRVRMNSVSTGAFLSQCVFLLFHTDPEVMEAGVHCTGHFGYKSKSTTPYMPHLSLLYADTTEQEKQRAKEKAKALDESISSNLSFTISRIALHKTDPADKTLKSWEMVAEFDLV